MGSLRRIVALTRTAEPRCGQVLVVGVDGPSGSGKTTLADRAAAALGAPVLHMDDLYPGWDGLSAAPGLLADQVLHPLSNGQAGSYRRWDWHNSTWAERVHVPIVPILIVEGCGSTVRPAAAYVALAVWAEADLPVRMARGIERDGEAFRPHWKRWAEQERRLFAADGTRARADVIVSTNPAAAEQDPRRR